MNCFSNHFQASGSPPLDALHRVCLCWPLGLCRSGEINMFMMHSLYCIHDEYAEYCSQLLPFSSLLLEKATLLWEIQTVSNRDPAAVYWNSGTALIFWMLEVRIMEVNTPYIESLSLLKPVVLCLNLNLWKVNKDPCKAPCYSILKSLMERLLLDFFPINTRITCVSKPASVGLCPLRTGALCLKR